MSDLVTHTHIHFLQVEAQRRQTRQYRPLQPLVAHAPRPPKCRSLRPRISHRSLIQRRRRLTPVKAPLDWRCQSDSISLTRDFIRLLQRCIAPDFLSIHICLVPSVRPVDSTGHGSRCIPYLDLPRDLPWHYVRSDSEISSAYGCDSRGCSRIIFGGCPVFVHMLDF